MNWSGISVVGGMLAMAVVSESWLVLAAVTLMLGYLWSLD